MFKVDSSEIFKNKSDLIVHKIASKSIRHLACVIPSAIVEAEVEADLALQKNAVIKMENRI